MDGTDYRRPGQMAEGEEMKRWKSDLPAMRRHMRVEKMIHDQMARWLLGASYEECECFGKYGMFRKRRPMAETVRWFRAVRQQEKRLRNKRQRREPINDV